MAKALEHAVCPHCQEAALGLYVDEAAHDSDLLDVVVECYSCGRTINAFVSISNDMTVVTPGNGEVL